MSCLKCSSHSISVIESLAPSPSPIRMTVVLEISASVPRIGPAMHAYVSAAVDANIS